MVGAGVSGLTTAVVLAEAGIDVEVVSDLLPSATTSAAAGASWGPFLAHDHRILKWSAHSLRIFTANAAPGTGIRMVRGIEAHDASLEEAPAWATAVPGYERCPAEEVPGAYVGAWRYTIPLMDMPTYLDYLVARLTASRGRLSIEPTIESLEHLAGDIVVNCAGLGAARLARDDGLVPVRGQLLVVANPGITDFFQDNVAGDDMVCIFPHGGHVILGGVSKTGDADVAWDYGQERAMRERAARIEPSLRDATVIGRRVGLRPGRPSVRLERDDSNRRIIHNYGHGGSGVTLSWGCAADVLELVRQN